MSKPQITSVGLGLPLCPVVRAQGPLVWWTGSGAIKLCLAAQTDSQVPLVEPDLTGYSTVSADAASVEAEAPALACPAQWSLLVEALRAAPASLVVHNRVQSAAQRMQV